MNNTNDVTIRGFLPDDRHAVRTISYETAFLGAPAQIFFGDREVLADALTLYFTDHEPGSCFVALAEGKVIGYSLGAVNVSRMSRVNLGSIYIPLLFKAARRKVFADKRTLKFLMRLTAGALRGEFIVPDVSKEYPATMHINMAGDFRGHSIGTDLLKTQLEFFRKAGTGGVHIGTWSENAVRFFVKAGFRLLFERKRTFFEPYGKKGCYYICGIKL